MGSNNPGRYRREGRNAFYPGGDPEESCPYKTDGSWNAQHNRPIWIDGWREAEKAYVPKEEYGGYLAALREEFTDEEINEMSNVALIEAIDAIDERNVKGF